MIRKLFRWVVRSAVVAGAVALVMRLLRRGEEEPDVVDVTDRSSAVPAAGAEAASSSKSKPSSEGTDWVASEEGACPASHPVKVKESSGIFHVPGGLAYDRTVADRCYRDAEAAEADGFRSAKR